MTGRDTSALTGWALSAIQTALGGRRGRWWGCWWGRSRPTIAAMTTRRAAARAVGVAHAAGSLREMSRGQGPGQGLGQGRGQGGRRIVAGWPRAAGLLAGQPDRGSCPACTRMNSPSRHGATACRRSALPLLTAVQQSCSPRCSTGCGGRTVGQPRRRCGQACARPALSGARASGRDAAAGPGAGAVAQRRAPDTVRDGPGLHRDAHRDVRRHGRRRRVAHR